MLPESRMVPLPVLVMPFALFPKGTATTRSAALSVPEATLNVSALRFMLIAEDPIIWFWAPPAEV